MSEHIDQATKINNGDHDGYDFDSVSQQIFALARLARMIPPAHVRKWVTQIGASEAFGFVIDPTGSRAAEKRLEIMKRVGNGLLSFQNALPDLQEAKNADDYCERLMALAGRGREVRP